MLIFNLVRLFVTWLFIASLVGIASKKWRLPYTVGLVLVGLVLTIVIPLVRTRAGVVSPEDIRSLFVPNLILTLLVPPLVFEAAFHIRLDDLRRELKAIILFAIPGVALTMLLVGGVIAWGAGLNVAVALVFGALIAATDPVAVVSLFRALGAPKRLSMLVEGESLFNDGTAIVLFHLMLAIVATGEFRLIPSVLDFLRVSLGGLLIGWLLGQALAFIIRRVDDYLVEISLSIVGAYGAYLIGEHFEFSGVLAVVMLGLISGNVARQGMSETTQGKLLNFWEFAAFLANTFVFLLIGLMINIGDVLGNLGYILLAILAVLFARAAAIYGLSRLHKDIPASFQHVLFWGGLRGAVSLALALSLTVEDLGVDLKLLQTMAFGVVLFTLIVQGTTMAPLLRRLKLIGTPASESG